MPISNEEAEKLLEDYQKKYMKPAYEKIYNNILIEEEHRRITDAPTVVEAQAAYMKAEAGLAVLREKIQAEYSDEDAVEYKNAYLWMFILYPLGICCLFFGSPHTNLYACTLGDILIFLGIYVTVRFTFLPQNMRNDRIDIIRLYTFDRFMVAKAYVERLEHELGMPKKEHGHRGR